MKKRFIALLVFFEFFLIFNTVQAESIWDEAFRTLDEIRMKKKGQLFDYLDKIRKNAQAVNSDPIMLSFFHLKNTYYKLQKTSLPPMEIVDTIADLKKNIREHYIRKYIAFYDILFINREGDIFYTIRRQADYHKNLFQGNLKESVLARQLMKNPRTEFVDYQFYQVSKEPSSFYVVPIIKENRLEGWFAFQLAINKINSIFTQDEGLGQTGEIFLVNKDQYMLTDSRFYGGSSILKQHLSRDNILAKFKEKKGHKIIVDYRGYRALSSFEVCRIEDNEWLLIAKLDEAEVLTRQYNKTMAELDNKLLRFLQEAPPRGKDCTEVIADENFLLVDMDEFRRVNKGERLGTYGVSTCTVLIISYPNKFAYMGHISSLDTIYGGSTTDLIANMIKHIKTFDIYPYEKRKLKITLVATHLETFQKTLHILIRQGFLLSQITFLYNPEARSASPIHDYTKNYTQVEWLMDRGTGKAVRSYSSGEKDLGRLVNFLSQASHP